MITFFVVCFVIVVICIVVGTWVAPFAYSTISEEPNWRITAALVVLAIVSTAAVVTWGISADTSSVHQWEGGNGPNTKCHYQQEEVSSGKTVRSVTYTVCE